MLILLGLSWCYEFQNLFHVPNASNKGNIHQDWAFENEAMPISKEDDKGSWEQYHIILLSHIVLYWIWSLLGSDESLLVTWVSPPIFGLQHCCRFRKRMQLDMGGLRLNTLFSTTFSIIFFFTSFSFSSISLPFAVYFSSFSILSRLSVLKWTHAHIKRRWQEFVGAISHNTSFTHCPVLNLILAWFGWMLVGNLSF